jgi:hypothetical protein
VTAAINRLPRDEKRRVCNEVCANLETRKKAGPDEPGLDGFIIELKTCASALGIHVDGKSQATGAQADRFARADAADVQVDTLLRHIEGYACVEASRRSGANVVAARALYYAAFPDGLKHVDERIIEENRHCRDSLQVLKAPEHQATLQAIGMPGDWVSRFEAAVNESDAAIADLIKTRGEKSDHVSLGVDAESQWVDLFVRLRAYVNSRASRKDAAKRAEGKALLHPLLAAVDKMNADAALRATLREKQAAVPPPVTPAVQPK